MMNGARSDHQRLSGGQWEGPTCAGFIRNTDAISRPDNLVLRASDGVTNSSDGTISGFGVLTTDRAAGAASTLPLPPIPLPTKFVTRLPASEHR
jgi:hypothetical protein